jgi:hypothetical protein
MAGIGPMVLPCGGGLMEQPALALEAFECFDRWLEEKRQDAAPDGC